LLKEQTVYRELGSNYFDQQDKEGVSRRLVKRLERLGYKISLKPLPAMESTA
jgi:transposase